MYFECVGRVSIPCKVFHSFAKEKGLMVAWNLHRRDILYIRNRPSSSPTRPPISRKTWNFNGDAGESRTRSTGSQYSTARDRYRVRCRGSKWIGTLGRGNSESSRIYDHSSYTSVDRKEPDYWTDSSESTPAGAQILGVAILEFGILFHSVCPLPRSLLMTGNHWSYVSSCGRIRIYDFIHSHHFSSYVPLLLLYFRITSWKVS
jgi:hypothetical protein